jgi:SAM-dependent methyltransferase
MTEAWRELNRAWWDERVPIHTASDFYDLDAFVADPTASTLRPFEVDDVGDVTGVALVHLQCHFGLDTLSWARAGARVTGVDFSGPAVEAATDAAVRARLDARFVAGDVYDAAELVGGATFDLVYTGLGALNWLPDVERWAAVVAALLRPGGRLYLAEFHPITTMFADDDLTVEHPYFHDAPLEWDDGGTYADLTAETTNNRTIEWNHGLGAVVTAVVHAGLVVDRLRELDHTLFQRWPFLVRDPDQRDTYRLPEGMPRLPLMYTLSAHRPAGTANGAAQP